jgi:catechol 2,3-dioxygenase-like lactoylglutathione lyase family enzyme/GNAT superfamily N-acetyltransferase
MQVVPFAPEHQADVVDLIVGIQRGEFEIDIDAGRQPDLHDIPSTYQTGAGNFWVALEGRQVVGTISLLDIGAGRGALRKMFVHPEFRGARIGTARSLLDTLLAWATERSLREIFLGTTSRFHAAHRFYEKNGFSEIPKDRLPASFPVMEVDTKFYHCRLPERGAASGPAGPSDSRTPAPRHGPEVLEKESVMPGGQGILSFDHVAIPIEKVDAMLAFYGALGFEPHESKPPYFWSMHLGDQKINFHGPELWRSPSFTLRGRSALPGSGDFCFVWGGSHEALLERLQQAGARVEEGPVSRVGGRGEGTSVYVRDPDSNLLEFIRYEDA